MTTPGFSEPTPPLARDFCPATTNTVVTRPLQGLTQDAPVVADFYSRALHELFELVVRSVLRNLLPRRGRGLLLGAWRSLPTVIFARSTVVPTVIFARWDHRNDYFPPTWQHFLALLPLPQGQEAFGFTRFFGGLSRDLVPLREAAW